MKKSNPLAIILLSLFFLFGFAITILGIYLGFLFKEDGIIAFAMAGFGVVFMLFGLIPLLVLLDQKQIFNMEKAKYGFLLIVGICIISGGIVFVSNSVKYVKSAVPVQAEIVSMDKYYERKSDLNRQQVEKHQVFIDYEFNGKTYENQKISSWWFSWKEGSRITVYCSEREDGSVQARTHVDLWGVAVIIFFVGSICTYGGIYFLRHYPNNKENFETI